MGSNPSNPSSPSSPGSSPPETRLHPWAPDIGTRANWRVDKHPLISGLFLVLDFVADDSLATYIETLEWQGVGVPPNPELRRRTMQFGSLFVFRTRTLEPYIPIPTKFTALVEKVTALTAELGIAPALPFNHLLVNEYLVGQGIMPHIDSLSVFAETVCSLSLLSPCVMHFSRGQQTIPVLLPVNSLLVLTGQAREEWSHSISKLDLDTSTDKNGFVVYTQRDRRISVTIRSSINTPVVKAS